MKLPNIKDKERILKAAREKERVTYKGVPIRLQLISQKKPCRQEGAGKKYSKSWKAKAYIQDYSTQQSYHLELKGRQRAFQKNKQTNKEFIITKPLLHETLKGRL